MSRKSLAVFQTGRSKAGLALVVVGGVAAFGLLVWMLRRGSGESEAEGARATMTVRTPVARPARVSSSLDAKPAVANARESRPEIEALRKTIAELKARAYALPPGGPLPTATQRKQMLQLTTEVKQPNWPGRNNTEAWLKQGIADNGSWRPWNEAEEKERRRRYSQAEQLSIQSELIKLRHDPKTSAIVAGYLQWLAENLERNLLQNPADVLALPLDAYVKAIDKFELANECDAIDQQIAGLGLPDLVRDFLTDQTRAKIFEAGLLAIPKLQASR